ncbi:hypothetical protein KF946_07890 [Idiomarina loihiensis]|uniref:hypothetical protein n=1 Tax=Idiomarina loihiensis TaxID=135577 RepID=UPI00129C170A|nr:hypothetical protein [Idiomarina loihiensis]MRJ43377.1 hypothetical protein [Idiomarina loihiensis]UTW31959.1 hypothetical protein KF946_07890 [Idiomarina loihiensis]
MYSKYIILIDKNATLPSRSSIVESAWGNDVPISFIQDNEVLNDASYLDFKVNKWEANSKWSEMQDDEPMIRVEIFREERVADFLRDNELWFAFDYEHYFLVALELDDGWHEVDQFLLARVVKVLAENQKVYAYDDVKGYIDCGDYLQSLPSKEAVRKSVFLD